MSIDITIIMVILIVIDVVIITVVLIDTIIDVDMDIDTIIDVDVVIDALGRPSLTQSVPCRIAGTLAHIVLGDRMWYARLTGQPTDSIAPLWSHPYAGPEVSAREWLPGLP
jgi:hypothetical protein